MFARPNSQEHLPGSTGCCPGDQRASEWAARTFLCQVFFFLFYISFFLLVGLCYFLNGSFARVFYCFGIFTGDLFLLLAWISLRSFFCLMLRFSNPVVVKIYFC